MSTFRTFARISGIVFLCVGLICALIGFNLLFNLADVRAYVQLAFILIPIGIAVILLSYLLPSD